jgi:hypothetical protein
MNLALHIRNYLLGSLQEEDTELLEELFFVNADVASLLCIVEDDLVDAYVRGGLTGEVLAGFESFYLASPRRCARVSFAAQFLRIVDR